MQAATSGRVCSVCRFRRTLAAALLLILAGVATSSAYAAVPDDFVGIDDPYLAAPSYRAAAFAAQRRAGIGLVRHAMDASTIERREGKFNFADYDNLVGRAASNGLSVMPVLVRKPRAGARYYLPPKNAAFARFATAAVKRYGTDGSFWKQNPTVPKRPITAWQLWNEPNLPIYWADEPDARAYASLLAAGAKAIKSADDRAEIVTAGLPDSRFGIPLDRYIGQLYRAGAKRAFDVLAINAYTKTAAAAIRKLKSIRRLMDKRGDKGGKLWMTEIGWSDSGPSCPSNVGARGQARQAASLLTLAAKSARKLRLRGVVYYAWRDLRPYPPAYLDFCGLHGGLLDIKGKPKKALASFSKAAAQIK